MSVGFPNGVAPLRSPRIRGTLAVRCGYHVATLDHDAGEIDARVVNLVAEVCPR